MKILLRNVRSQVADRDGFVLPMVIFGLVLMSTVAVAALVLSGDEHRSSRAMRESAAAFYAAEAGLNEVWATWPDDQVSALNPGQSVDLGWTTLDSRSSYRAVIHRDDDGSGEPMYSLTSEGRAAGPQGGQRTLSMVFSAELGSGFSLGLCCDGPITMRGIVTAEDDWVMSGKDTHPPGFESSGMCQELAADKPGIIVDDVDLVDLDYGGGGVLEGDPPIEERTLTDAEFDNFGDLSWDQIRNMADHIIDSEGANGSDNEFRFGQDDPPIQPSYNGDGTCNTDDPYNWGSNDPNDACFDYFPIIVIRGEVELYDTYGQGIIIVDWDNSLPDGEKGSELELEDNFTFAGVVLARGCVEIQRDSKFYGALLIDGGYLSEDLCGGGSNTDGDLSMDRGSDIFYSQCAVDRAMVLSGLADHGEATNPGGAQPIGIRAFTEVSR